MDVDSTLIQEEGIELLADYAGKREEVARITTRAMQGEIDFAESLRERVATLSGLSTDIFAQTVKAMHLTPGVEQLIEELHKRGWIIGVVSGGFIETVGVIGHHIGLDEMTANKLEAREGVLTGKVDGSIVDGLTKKEKLLEWAQKYDVPLTNTVAIGDGANDLFMMEAAGLGIAWNAKPVVQEKADTALNTDSLFDALAIIDAHFS